MQIETTICKIPTPLHLYCQWSIVISRLVIFRVTRSLLRSHYGLHTDYGRFVSLYDHGQPHTSRLAIYYLQHTLNQSFSSHCNICLQNSFATSCMLYPSSIPCVKLNLLGDLLCTNGLRRSEDFGVCSTLFRIKKR